MFGIGMPEMLLILAIALIVIGPKKLPDLAKSLGKAMGEFKNAASDLKDSIGIDNDDFKEVKTTFEDINKDIRDTVDLSASQAEKKETPKSEEPGDEDQKDAASKMEDLSDEAKTEPADAPPDDEEKSGKTADIKDA